MPVAISRRLPLPAKRRHLRWCLALALLAAGWFGVTCWAAEKGPAPPVYGYRVVNAYPHDPHAFSQGLVIADGQLYEGTGQYGHSELRKVDLETGEVQKQVSLDRRLFGEGITVLGDRIYQLTWRSGLGIVYDRETFQEVDRFRVRGEGWGLTHDGENLILSNGTATLQIVDPKTFHVLRRINVRDQGWAVRNLNELEYVGGGLLANVWGTDRIAWISLKTGNVIGWIDLSGLKPKEIRRDSDAVLNGIAYDAEAKRLFVTGKNWPKLFEIRIVKPQ